MRIGRKAAQQRRAADERRELTIDVLMATVQQTPGGGTQTDIRARAAFVHDRSILMAQWCIENGGLTYTEWTIGGDGTNGIGPFVLTLQRLLGKTPHQLRQEAEQERDDAQAIVNQIPAAFAEAFPMMTYGDPAQALGRLAAYAQKGYAAEEGLPTVRSVEGQDWADATAEHVGAGWMECLSHSQRAWLTPAQRSALRELIGDALRAERENASRRILVAMAGLVSTPAEGYRSLDHALSDLRSHLSSLQPEQGRRAMERAADQPTIDLLALNEHEPDDQEL